MKDLVEFIAKSLVEHPEEVRVTESDGEKTTVLELRVAAGELGKVIGRQGRTARAIRTVLNCAGIKRHRRAILEIIE